MKNYYELLDIPQSADEKDIKKAYRQLALKYHPDRNPGDPAAEDRFKNIAEAYSVLIDKEKREHYDLYNKDGGGYGYSQTSSDFSYSREDIFSSFFNDPRQSAFINELRKDFERQGYRFDEKFLNEVFFRGGAVFFGSVFTSGPNGVRYRTFGRDGFGNLRDAMGSNPSERLAPASPPSLGQIAEKIGQKIGNFLFGRLSEALPNHKDGRATAHKDIYYRMTLSPVEASQGKEVIISFMRGDRMEKVAVKVPAGIKDGTKLKLRQMGVPAKDGVQSGNLYIQVKIQ